LHQPVLQPLRPAIELDQPCLRGGAGPVDPLLVVGEGRPKLGDLVLEVLHDPLFALHRAPG